MEKSIKKYFPIFVMPTLIAFIIGFIIPFCEGIYLSFCKFSVVKNAQWVGFSNYISAINDKTFVCSAVFTAIFTVVSIFTINVFAFILALLLTKRIKGTNLFRTVFFMPNLIGGIVLGYIWQILINCVLTLIDEPLLALNEAAGFWGLIILMSWQQIGYMMIIYIAGLQSVPSDVLEAADIDGASAWKKLIHITIPMLMPSITICVFLTLVNSFKLFDQNLALTAGEPAHATEMLALNIFNTFYARAGTIWKGVGQAKSVIFCAIVMLIAMVQLAITHTREVEQ